MNYFNYFTEIEDTFVRRRGKHLFLSPLDWALIDEWKSRGIPLHIVIRSIESVFDVFDKQPAGTRSIKSLFYCREEIDSQYSEWLASRTGSHHEGGDDDGAGVSQIDISQHIAGAIEKLRAVDYPALAEDISRAIVRLEELRVDLFGDNEAVDKTLGDIERLLDRAMLANWEPQHLKAIERDVATQLGAYKAEMEPAAYKQTYELMLLKRLRDEARIPRLSLFYL